MICGTCGKEAKELETIEWEGFSDPTRRLACPSCIEAYTMLSDVPERNLWRSILVLFLIAGAIMSLGLYLAFH